ncbi:MAG: methionine adenosyltransferase [Parachlamydiales bacterium]|jgi:S-adenosylmethionine synthetase
MQHYLFTSESVSSGHPDKIADQISDAILDSCLEHDPHSRVACETLVSSGLVVLAGEITTHANIDYRAVVRETIKKIGYNNPEWGFDYHSCGILTTINKQSPEIAAGVSKGHKKLGAGDQGLMFGFACNETPELMPLPIMLAHSIIRQLRLERQSGNIPYLRPDAKAQVTVQYTPDHKPKRIHAIVISTQHNPDVTQEQIKKDMQAMAAKIIPSHLLDDQTTFFINPSGSFIQGGPASDCGLTGRKIIVDTYGGRGRHGGGAFSGKDPTKVDRSGGYAARYVAKNIVAAGLADTCEVQISYAIGRVEPVSIRVETFGTSKVNECELEDVVHKLFDLTPGGIIETLQMLRPIYFKTASEGHFGRTDPEFTWERTDKVPQLKAAFPKSLS